MNNELDFSPTDSAEHLRRVAHICKLLNNQGIITICSFISADKNIRSQLKEIIGQENFHTIFMDASLDYCKNNKPELYDKYETGEAKYLPGVDVPFDIPEDAVLKFDPVENGNNVEANFGLFGREENFSFCVVIFFYF